MAIRLRFCPSVHFLNHVVWRWFGRGLEVVWRWFGGGLEVESELHAAEIYRNGNDDVAPWS